MPITLGQNPLGGGGFLETGISPEEVNRIKHAGSMNEAVQRGLWDKIKDWLHGTAGKGRAVRERLYAMSREDYPASVRVGAFFELQQMVDPGHQSRFHLLIDKGNPHDPQAPARVMMEIEGLWYGECVTVGAGLARIGVPPGGLMVRYDGFSPECPLGSRLFAAGLLFPPHCDPPPVVTHLDETGKKVVRPSDWDGKNVEVEWRVKGEKLRHDGGEGAGAKTTPGGLSRDFCKDFPRGDYEFFNENMGVSASYHYGLGGLLGDEPGGGEGIGSSGGNTVEEALEEIKGIFPDGVFACLSEIMHQGYFAELMAYIYERYLGGLKDPPLMLNQEKGVGGGDPPPAYSVTLGSDGNCCIEAACIFELVDPKNFTRLGGSKLKAKRVTVIGQKDLLSGNVGASHCEYHFKLQDSTENLFCFTQQ